jgi:hypothetical protein
MSDQEQPKRRGRPPKYAGEGKRQNFSFRIRDAVRERLVKTVDETGRSLSEEIEWRIERSYEWEDAYRDAQHMKQSMLAEAKAQIAEMLAGNLRPALHAAGWPKMAGTKYGTVYVDPGSSKPADFGEGDRGDDLMPIPPAGTSKGLDEEAVYRAVTRALRETLPATLTNRDKAETPEPPTIAPAASPTEAAAWAPVTAPSPDPTQDA